MAGIEQKMRRRAGSRHQRVDFVRALDDRAHVMVVDERDTLIRKVGGEGFEPLGETRHFRTRQARARAKRYRCVAVYRIRRLAHDHDLAAVVTQLGEVGLAGFDLGRNVAHQQVRRIPTRNEDQPMAGKKETQRLGFFGPAVAVLHPVEPDLKAGLV
jgi:hypothetical protein